MELSNKAISAGLEREEIIAGLGAGKFFNRFGINPFEKNRQPPIPAGSLGKLCQELGVPLSIFKGGYSYPDLANNFIDNPLHGYQIGGNPKAEAKLKNLTSIILQETENITE